MDEFNKILHVRNLIDLIRDLSPTINDPSFREIMDDMMDDDRLTETIIYLDAMFKKD